MNRRCNDVARLRKKGGAFRVLVVNPWGKYHLQDLRVDERIILKWIFRKWDGIARTGLTWSRIGTGGGLL
jgi:hypothetical protein